MFRKYGVRSVVVFPVVKSLACGEKNIALREGCGGRPENIRGGAGEAGTEPRSSLTGEAGHAQKKHSRDGFKGSGSRRRRRAGLI